MAGRALTKHLFPFVSSEIDVSYLFRFLRFGMLPPVVLADDPEEVISTYVGDYLREEIQAEALTRKIEYFSRFLYRAALSNAEIINFESIASDAQIPPRTIREYYSILTDTLLGTMLEPLQTSGKRKPISHGKFYFFDVGVVNALLGSFEISDHHPLLGKCFEHFVFQELRAYLSYRKPKYPFNFWRTQQGDEVDFVINKEIAIEIKASTMVSERDIKSLMLLSKETKLQRMIIVSRDEYPRILTHKESKTKIEVLPIHKFLEQLWANKIL